MRLLAFLVLWSVTVFGQNKPDENKGQVGESTFTEGMMLFVLEDYSGALKQFETFIKLDEKSAVGYYMKSRAENALNMSVKAEQSAETSVDLDKKVYYYQQNYAEILKKNNKNKQAQEAFKTLIKLKPEHIEAYYALLELQVAGGQPTDALKTLDEAEKQFGASEKITQAKQTILLKENKVDAALKEGNKQVSANPEFVLNQAKILVESNRTKEAINMLEEATKANVDFVEGYGLLSELYATQKNTTESLKLLREIVNNTSFPYSLKANAIGNNIKAFGNESTTLPILQEITEKLIAESPNQARAYVYAGDLNFRSNNLLKASTAYSQAVKLDKNQFEVWLALAQINYRLGDFKKLEKEADNATMYFPNNGNIWVYLALAQLKNEKLNDAEIALEEAGRLVANAPWKASYDAVLGEFYRTKGDTKKAEETKKGITPSDELGRYFLATTLLISQPEKALLTIGKLSEEIPQSNLYKIEFAKALLAVKKPAEALEAVNFIKKEELEVSTEGLEVKGDVLAANGRMEEAQTEWRKALELNKTNKRIQDKLKQQ